MTKGPGVPALGSGIGKTVFVWLLEEAAPLPNILQAENVIVGMDFELFNTWLVRIEADPGL